LKRRAPDIPPEVAKAFFEDMRAYHAEPNPIKRDEIAARAGWRLEQHYIGRLRLGDIKRMFEQMRIDGEDR
jgi:hypothetical protein